MLSSGLCSRLIYRPARLFASANAKQASKRVESNSGDPHNKFPKKIDVQYFLKRGKCNGSMLSKWTYLNKENEYFWESRG